MERKRLLYLVSSDPRVSPFDINMAYDAGFDAVVLARAGASVVLTSRDRASAAEAEREIAALFEVSVEPREAPAEADRAALAAQSDVVLATGAAGVQLLSKRTVETLRGPKVLADVNAGPPHGLEG